MASIFSSLINKFWIGDHSATSQIEEAKMRLRMSSSYNDENLRLIPILPDEISLQIIARVPRIHYLSLKCVSRGWKAAITSPEVYKVRQELGKTEEWLYILMKEKERQLVWHALDPVSRKWQRLPLMPDVVSEDEQRMFYSIKILDVLRGWLGQSVVADQIPFYGSSIGAVNGCLYMIGGFPKAAPMKRVWQYDPCVNSWQEVCSMMTGRAFCKTSLLNNKLYVAGGICRDRGGLTPLRSAEVYEPSTGLWSQVENIPFSNSESIAENLDDMLRPIATGMISYRGRLCVLQSMYAWPSFVDIGGEIYDPETNSWEEMPPGMADGWPARQEGNKLGVVVEGELYALDPSDSSKSSKVKLYDHQEDVWKVVIEDVPNLDYTDIEAPYLLAGIRGDLHVIATNANNDTVVLQANLHRRHTSSSPATSLSPPSNHTIKDGDASSVEEQSDAWKVIAYKNFGVAQLVNCQVLDV